jgi:ribonuclease R
MTPVDDDDLARAVLALVNGPNYQPVKPRVLARRLGLSQDDAVRLRRVIKQLARHGQLAYGASHIVRPAGQAGHAASDRVTGVYRRAREGYGFVRPAGVLPGDTQNDIYVSAHDARDAAHGDLVLVKIVARHGARGRREGVILEVIERETHRFVGTYYEEAGQGMVQVDGQLFARPVPVGDPGAKNAQPNDKVVFEMIRFPTHAHDGEGVIVEVLGPRGAPGVDTLSVIHEFGLPGEFSAGVLHEARRVAGHFHEHVPASRTDLTAATVITIDPADARDFDDAISLCRQKNGHWELGVHIADVSHFVKAGGELDREAYERGNSVYLPDRVLPMLPETISNGVASLQPGRVRFTKTCLIEFTPTGTPVGAEVFNSAIRSKRRLTYEEVDDFLAHRQAWRHKLDPDVFRLLDEMRELAMILRKRRMERGALELNMPEVKIDLDENGRVCGAHVVPYTESHQIIEEFMLSANQAVAEKLRDAEWLFLRRVHEAPSPRKQQALTQFVKDLGLTANNLQDRFELQALLRTVTGRPEERAVNYAVLRSMAQAVYSPAEEGHYALASDCYCHFTSPIRRYPDLTIHRLIDCLISGKKPHFDPSELAVQGQHCSDRERRAEAAERELTTAKLLFYFSQRVGEEFDAVITGVEAYGLFAQGVHLPAEGLIHIGALDDDYYDFERETHSLTGRRRGNRFRLGDLVRVKVARVDLDRRELDFRLVAKKTRPERPRAAKKRPQRRKAKSPQRRPSKRGGRSSRK